MTNKLRTSIILKPQETMSDDIVTEKEVIVECLHSVIFSVKRSNKTVRVTVSNPNNFEVRVDISEKN